jgi:ribosomal-protein-alanine N-acetyltransferase
MDFNFTPFPELETERLLLRKATKKDVPVILFLRSDPNVNKYIKRPVPKNEDEAEVFLNKVNKGVDDGENIYWAITQKGTTKMLGAISLWNFSADRKKAEVGYDLNPEFHNRGIMSEALVAAVDFGFNTLNFELIDAYTHFENESSKRMLVKNGFILNENRKDDDNTDNIIFELRKQS